MKTASSATRPLLPRTPDYKLPAPWRTLWCIIVKNIMLQLFHWLYPFFRGVAYGLLAMTLHELGHIAAALLLGVRVKQVGLRWKGLFTVREAGPPAKNIAVSLAGPATNFLLLLVTPWSHIFALANACMGFFNILPIRGSDGDRALALWLHLQKEKAANAGHDPGSTRHGY